MTSKLIIPGTLEMLTTGILAAVEQGSARLEYSHRAGFQLLGEADEGFLAEAKAVIRGYLAAVGIKA